MIVPSLKKGAFLFGGKYGRGFIVCRAQSGHGWSAPAGGEETDAIMLVMSKGGAEKLLASKFTLGGDASVAGTNLQVHAEIFTYSRSRGAFAGISLEGVTLRPAASLGADLMKYSDRKE